MAGMRSCAIAVHFRPRGFALPWLVTLPFGLLKKHLFLPIYSFAVLSRVLWCYRSVFNSPLCSFFGCNASSTYAK